MFSTQAIASNIYFHCNYCIQRILPHCIIQGFVTWCFSVFSYNRSLHEESWHNWQCSTTCPRGFRDCCICATMQRWKRNGFGLSPLDAVQFETVEPCYSDVTTDTKVASLYPILVITMCSLQANIREKHLTSLCSKMYYVPTHPNIVSYAWYPYYLRWGSATLYSFCKKKVAFVWPIYDDMEQKQSDILWAAGTLRLTSGASICTAKPTNQVCISAFQVLPSSLHNHPVAFVASFSIHEMFAGEMLF